MKTLFTSLVVTYFICFNLFQLNGQVTLGSGVSRPVLNIDNVNTYFNVLSGGYITEDIIVDGDLEISDLEHFTFYSITVSGGNITFTDPIFHTAPIFRGCEIINGGNLILTNSTSLILVGTKIEKFDVINIEESSALGANATSSFVDIGNIFVTHSAIFADDVTFDNSPLSARDAFILQVNNCTVENSIKSGFNLTGSGMYKGVNNLFSGNNYGVTGSHTDGFMSFNENGSTYQSNILGSIGLSNVTDIIISNSNFDEELSDGKIINIDRGIGNTSIENNTLEGNNNTGVGIFIVDRHSTSVVENTIEGMTEVAMSFDLINGLIVDNNELLNNSGADGIKISSCPESQIISNNVTEHNTNIDISLSDKILLESNICSYSELADIRLENTQTATLCNNLCYHGGEGILVTSTNSLMEMNDNSMTHCDRGLVYTMDVMTSPQIEKGNYFLLNNHGAEFEGGSDLDPDLINSMRYVVRNYTTEYPSHSPSVWFRPIGTTALDCNPIDPNDPPVDSEPEINNLFSTAVAASPDGRSLNNIMVGLKIVDAQSAFLLNNYIDSIYGIYHGTCADLLPLLSEILVNFDEFEFDTTADLELVGDSLFLNLEESIDYLSDKQDKFEYAINNYSELIEDEIEAISELEPESEYEENYQFAILELLTNLKGDTSTTSNLIDIVEIAEGCISEYGPAVYIAQALAERLDLPFDRNNDCSTIEPRSFEDKNDTNIYSNIDVFPNPATTFIKIQGTLPNSKFSILDILGREVKVKEDLNKDIDISMLAPGIYFVRLQNSPSKVKFIKS